MESIIITNQQLMPAQNSRKAGMEIMKAADRNKIIKYLIIIIDIFTIIALALQIHSNIIRVCFKMKSGVFYLVSTPFLSAMIFYGFVGAITNGSALIETYEHYGQNIIT